MLQASAWSLLEILHQHESTKMLFLTTAAEAKGLAAYCSNHVAKIRCVFYFTIICQNTYLVPLGFVLFFN